MSIYDVDLLSGMNKIETSIARIKEYCGGKKVLVAFSGGKDSQCCYHLAKMAGVDFHAQYSITRFEPPELLTFIRANYPDVTFRRAYKRSLYEDIKANGLPNRWYRWCCDAKHKKTEGYDIAIVGIRFAESARRANSWRVFGQKKDRTYYCCPICDWTDGDVWEFLNGNNIPHCSLYDEGYKRIGCVCCPLAPGRGEEKRWPKMADVLRKAFYAFYENKKSIGFKLSSGKVNENLASAPKEELFDSWLMMGDTRPEWARNGWQRDDEPCLFAGTGFSESDGAENQNESEVAK